MSDVTPTAPHLLLSLGALALLGWAGWLSLGRAMRAGWREAALRPGARRCFLLLVAGFAALLLRPHQDTFIGVDTSGYRHMTRAFSEGRPLQGVDAVLLEAPAELRRGFLLMPDMRWRNSRDRSFELMSIHTGETQPFFYPLLPLAAAGFDALVPGRAADYLLPTLAVVFAAAFLLAGAARGGGWGLFAAASLLLASPLPALFFRGYFPEVLGALLIGGVLLQVALAARGQALPASALFPLGLALSLHPLLVILVVPVLFYTGLAGPFTRARWFAGPAWLCAGALPLWAMTRWVCQPYGRLFDPAILWRNLQVSGEHRMVMLPALGVAVLCALALFLPRARLAAWRERLRGLLARPVVRIALLLVLLVALAAELRFAPVAPVLSTGLRELLGGARVPLLLLACACAGWIALRGRVRDHALLLLLLLLLPVFLYLKGVELVGLWSQRRLAPWVVLALVALLAGVSAFRAPVWTAPRWRVPAGVCAALLLAIAAFHNIARWPAPYLVRFEAGADDWIARLRGHIGAHLAFFDYHPYSFPVAVDGRTRALGLGEQANALLDPIVRWFGGRAVSEPVLFATAYSNPGLEAGLRLTTLAIETADVPRVRSRAALPAEAFRRQVRVELMRAEPFGADDAPALHKVFDGGPLALRGTWHARLRRLRNPAGETVPAQWSRQHSALIGPAPRNGESLRIRVQGVSGRAAGAVARLYLESEAGERSPPLVLGEDWTHAVVDWTPAAPAGGRTALYHLRAETPYDPATDHVRGFPRDLGALLHRMDIEVVSAHTPSLIHE